jgi:hypothetical protein
MVGSPSIFPKQAITIPDGSVTDSQFIGGGLNVAMKPLVYFDGCRSMISKC